MRKLIGLLVVLFGVAFLLDAMDVASFDTVGAYVIPSIIMLAGLLALRNNPRAWGGPLIIVLIGLTMLAEDLQWFDKSPWTFVWPLFVIIVGLQIILGRWQGPKLKDSTGRGDSFAVFSGSEEKKTGRYDGGTASATFGGIKLDLREADIQDGAVLQVWAAFGGIDLLVPKNVNVTTSVLPLFGGADNKAVPEPGATKTLHVSGTAMFGGVGIKN